MISPAATPPVPPAPEASAAPRFDAYQQAAPEGGGVTQAFNAALDGFGARTEQMQASLRDLAARDAPVRDASTRDASTRDASTGAARPAAASEAASPVSPAGGATGAQGAMALMVDCFNFAVEASLVSRAATQFTGSVSTLMKGQ